MAERRLAIVKRTSLADVAEGWDNCYISYRAAVIAEQKEMQQLNDGDLSNEKALDYMMSFIRAHTVGGRVLVVGDDGQQQEVDLEPADVENLPVNTLYTIFGDINGARLDPKDIPPAVAPGPTPAPGAKPTVTPSSTN